MKQTKSSVALDASTSDHHAEAMAIRLQVRISHIALESYKRNIIHESFYRYQVENRTSTLIIIKICII